MTTDLINFYKLLPKKDTGIPYPNYDKIRITLPTRVAVIAPSGAGKTNLAINFIFGIGAFERIYLCVKTPDEPLYQMLIEMYELIGTKIKKELITVVSDIDELPEVDTFDPKVQNLVIFDDMITAKDTKLKHISDFWIRGRKKNISTLFLSQDFYGIPVLIRKNTQIVLIRGIVSTRDLNLILKEFATDKTKEELLAMYKKCCPSGSSIENFFMIDNSVGVDAKYRYRHNWTPIE
jgi:hypothetical protein